MSLKLRVSIIFEDSSSLDASDREFQQDHAGYRILALPVNSYENEKWEVSNPNLLEFKRFLHITNRTHTMQQICQEIVEKYVKLYPNDVDINIEKLQDSEFCDLDPDYTVGAVFKEGDVVVAVLSESPLVEASKKTVHPSSTASKRKYQPEYPLNEFSDNQNKRTKRDSIWFHTDSSFSRNDSVDYEDTNISLSNIPPLATSSASPVLSQGPRLSPPEEQERNRRSIARRTAHSGNVSISSDTPGHQRSRLYIEQFAGKDSNYSDEDVQILDDTEDIAANTSTVSLPPPSSNDKHLPDPRKFSPHDSSNSPGARKSTSRLPVVESTPLSNNIASSFAQPSPDTNSPSRKGRATPNTVQPALATPQKRTKDSETKNQTPTTKRAPKKKGAQENVTEKPVTTEKQKDDSAVKPATKKAKKQPAKDNLVVPSDGSTPTTSQLVVDASNAIPNEKPTAIKDTEPKTKDAITKPKNVQTTQKNVAEPAVKQPAKRGPKPKISETGASGQGNEDAESGAVQPAKKAKKTAAQKRAEKKAEEERLKAEQAQMKQQKKEKEEKSLEDKNAAIIAAVATAASETAKEKERVAIQKVAEEKAAKAKKLAEEKAAKAKALEEEKAKKLAEEEKAAKAKNLAEEKAAKAKKLAEEKATKAKALEEEKAKKLAEEAKAKAKALEEEKAAKAKKLAEEKAAKAQKLAEEKAAKAKKLAEEKAAKAKKLAEEKEAKAKKLAEEKEAKAKALEEEKAAKIKKLAEEKAAKEKALEEEKVAKAKKIVEEKVAKDTQKATDSKASEEKESNPSPPLARKAATKTPVDPESDTDDSDVEMKDVSNSVPASNITLSKSTEDIRSQVESSEDSSDDSSSDDDSSDESSDEENDPKSSASRTSSSSLSSTKISTPVEEKPAPKKAINLPGLSKLSSLVARGPVNVHDSKISSALSKIRRPGGKNVIAARSQKDNESSESSSSSDDSDNDDDSDSDSDTERKPKQATKFGKAPAPSSKKVQATKTAPVNGVASKVVGKPLGETPSSSATRDGVSVLPYNKVARTSSAAAKKQKAKDLEELF